MTRLLVTGRMLDARGRLDRGGFVVEDGTIVAVGANAPHDERVDFGTRVLLPGAIDPHVHFRDPGHPEKEDFGSGSRAAALGGVTTVLDMPNTLPPVFTREALADKRARAEAKSVVDFGLYAGLDVDGTALSILSDATCLKIYLGASTGNLLVENMDLVRRALVEAHRAGRTVAVHCESQDCLERHAHLARDDDVATHADARPPECEADAIRALAKAAEGTAARVHVAHLSTRAGLAATPAGFSAEVTPHHLLLDRTLLRSGEYKMNPPLREAGDARAMWEALESGRISCLGSDHAPHTAAEKRVAKASACPSGVPGVQTMVPLLIAAGLPLARVAEASTAAARVFHLPRKGALAPGHDADFAVYDLAAARSVRASEMASKAGWTPFEGMPAVFPTDVFVRGGAVVADGKIVSGATRGRFVRPH